MQLSLIVPVKPEVKKYLENHPLIPKPFKLSCKIPAWQVLEGLTENKSFNVPLKYAEGTFIEVIIPNDNNKLIRPWVSPRKARSFNQIIKKMMLEKMMDYIFTAVRIAERHQKKVYVHELVREFADQYGITEKDWSFDAMIKDYQRWKDIYNSPMKSDAKIYYSVNCP